MGLGLGSIFRHGLGSRLFGVRPVGLGLGSTSRDFSQERGFRDFYLGEIFVTRKNSTPSQKK